MYIIYVNNTLPLALAVHKISRHFWVAYGLTRQSYYTAKNAQVATSLLTSCKSLIVTTSRFAWLATTCWRQVCCKMSTDLLQVDCQNLLSASLLQVSTSCNKSANDLLQLNEIDNFVATCWQVHNKPVRLTTYNKSVVLLTVCYSIIPGSKL